jgi:hypothetical protein
MRNEVETYVALLEKRVFLLHRLEQEFLDCRKDFISMDLDGIYSRIAIQEGLCRQIQALDPAIQLLQKVCTRYLGQEPADGVSAQENAAWADRLRAVMRELGEAQAEIGRLNQTHAAYLRRSRRTIHVLMNSLGMRAVTYAPDMKPAGVAVQMKEKGA